MATWSGLRKELEQDRLCPALRGRVQYFATHYHGAPDDYGRVCVRVDGKECPWEPLRVLWTGLLRLGTGVEGSASSTRPGMDGEGDPI